ncbi:MAG: hypothetical protein ACYC1D_15410 [Acidimicrobiales bacterium]
MGVSPGEHCKLVAISRNGTAEDAGAWRASYTGQANIDGFTAVAPAKLAALGVVTPTGTVLITLRLPAERMIGGK